MDRTMSRAEAIRTVRILDARLAGIKAERDALLALLIETKECPDCDNGFIHLGGYSKGCQGCNLNAMDWPERKKQKAGIPELDKQAVILGRVPVWEE